MTGLKNGRTSPGRGGEPYHIYGDLSPEFAVVAVRFRTWHAQDTASAHKDGWAGAPGCSTGAWMRAARVASLISANARSATPLYLGLSAGVNSCLIPRLRHNFPKFSIFFSPLSDLTAITADGVPSARTSARKDSKALAASDFLPRKYTHVNRVQSSRILSVYHFPPILGTVNFPLRSTNTRCSFLSALVCVDLAMGFRSPIAIEHPRQHSWSSQLRLTPCCSAIFLSSTSCVWP